MTGRLLRVGLTGGIATGKSVCLEAFRALGAATIDADVLARDAVAPGSPGLAAVVARFGPGVILASGALDRAALARIVFADASARRDLEAIVHPVVRARIADWFLAQESQPGDDHVAIADIPLLYETGRAQDFDRVVVAACHPEQQIARVMARDGLSRADALARIAAQYPIDDKRRMADLVIDTSGSLDDTARGVAAAWTSLVEAARRGEAGRARR